MSPLDRLASILNEKRIRATKKWWGLGGPSVAFTECPWASLLDHANHYSAYAIGFTKQQLWDQAGAPALYMRWQTLHAIRDRVNELAGGKVYPAVPEALGTLYTPIEREAGWKRLDGEEVDKWIDYSQEREWRVPQDFTFEYEDIQFS